MWNTTEISQMVKIDVRRAYCISVIFRDILDLPCLSKKETKKKTGRAWEGTWHLRGVKDVQKQLWFFPELWKLVLGRNEVSFPPFPLLLFHRVSLHYLKKVVINSALHICKSTCYVHFLWNNFGVATVTTFIVSSTCEASEQRVCQFSSPGQDSGVYLLPMGNSKAVWGYQTLMKKTSPILPCYLYMYVGFSWRFFRLSNISSCNVNCQIKNNLWLNCCRE